MSNYFFRFGFPQAFLFLPILLIFWWLYVRKKTTTYIYSRTHMLLSTGLSDGYIFQKILDGMRLLSLLVLIFLIARPQYIDEQSKLEVRGIDIVIALDVSGSMGLQDYADDSRSRFTIAKDEASRFIKKRDNDAIGLVVFGGIALLRCPITMDKKLLLTLVNDLELGDVDPGLTMLARGMLAGINRLKQSSAASKVIILLTDGAQKSAVLRCMLLASGENKNSWYDILFMALYVCRR
jgi:Ca-activated chloride channel family protein